ncbi:MAG: hypothetical protein FWF97_02945 [Alphaproteobacteria bacterium]|nr:hypothetical protein [Alphaproteobacteria bacterium]
MHILEYLAKIGKADQSSPTYLGLLNPVLKDAPFLDFSGIKKIHYLYLAGYNWNLVLPDVEEINNFELAGYDKHLQADKLRKTGTLGLDGCRSDVSLPGLQSTYNLALYDFPHKFNAPLLNSVGQLYFDNKTQLTLASGQKLISLPGYEERGFYKTHNIRGGDFKNHAFRGGVNAQARPGIYNVYGKTVFMENGYYYHVDTVGPGTYEITWNLDEKLLLLQNGDAMKFILLCGNKFFEGADFGECHKKYLNWQKTVFITDIRLEKSIGLSPIPGGDYGHELFIHAFYSDGTLAAYNVRVGFDRMEAKRKLLKLKLAKNLTLHQFWNIVR